MSEYRRYNLTLTVADPSARDRFRALSRPESFFEIRPNRSPGQRGAYSVEMTQDEYEAALEDAENPDVNLIVVEPVRACFPSAAGGQIPGADALNYLAAQNADSLGLTGKDVVIAVLDTGCDQAVFNSLGNTLKASKSFSDNRYDPELGRLVPDGGPFEDNNGHGTGMASLALPPAATAVIAKIGQGATDDSIEAAAIYWAVDEVGVNIISLSFGTPEESTVERDAAAHAASNGVLLFAAAGNGGGALYSPARYSGALAISNFNTVTDAPDPTTNFGTKVWAAAPGGFTCAYIPDGTVDCYSSDSGGTSNATALAAQIAGRFMTGERSSGNVVSYLADNARPTGASPLYEGAGVLQLAAAEQALQQDKPDKVDLAGNPMVGSDGSTQDGTGNPDPGACG